MSIRMSNESGVSKVYHYGAPTSFQSGKYFPIPQNSSSSALHYAKTLDLDLIIPCNPIYQMLDNYHSTFDKLGIPTLFPSKQNGSLEFSKIKTKELLQTLNIPTPKYQVFTYTELIDQFFILPRPFVFKFEEDLRQGLQTVIITDDTVDDEYKILQQSGRNRELKQFLGDFTDQKFIVEDFIDIDREYSYHILCSRDNYVYLGSSRDYKKIANNDVGINTPGMGSYGLVESDKIVKTYVDKIIDYLNKNNRPYVGILYFGIIVTRSGVPMILEINTRSGDPEFHNILPVITNDVSKLFYNAAINGPLEEIKFSQDKSVAIRIVNLDPQNNDNNFSERLKNIPPDICLYQSGIRNDKWQGVLTTTAATVAQASDKIYNYLNTIDMSDFTLRSDIGYLQ
jgi:phosphoribosylamine--glycine ligase